MSAPLRSGAPDLQRHPGPGQPGILHCVHRLRVLRPAPGQSSSPWVVIFSEGSNCRKPESKRNTLVGIPQKKKSMSDSCGVLG